MGAATTVNKIDLTRPVLPVSRPQSPPGQAKQANKDGGFAEILQDSLRATRQINFSKHALERLEHRNIALSAADLAKLDQAVEKAARKGARESLILFNDLALIVSVNNKTVVTAVDGQSMRENVFTNIDSAVIV